MDFGLLLLRAGVGISLAVANGYGKITAGPQLWEKIGGAMSNLGIHFLPVFWGFMASFAEFFCALLVAIGFLTRSAALLVAFTMFVAAYTHLYNGDGFGDASHAIELLTVFAALLFTGAGKYSIDARFTIARWLQ